MEIVPDVNKILGKGENAVVFEGIYNGPIKVAVKRILSKDVENNTEKEEAFKKLNHSNVIKLFHVESDSQFRYYALELCAASLDKVFLKDEDDNKYRGPFLPVEEILFQLASGLAYIHKNDLVYSDLKPENALISIWQDNSEKPQVVMKWADFGLYKQANEKGQRFRWVAPEIQEMYNSNTNESEMLGAETDAGLKQPQETFESDVFAEGLTFAYVLLEGEHPYGNDAISDYQKDINTVNLKKIARNHGRMLDLIQKMLSVNPAERLTAQEVVQRLQIIKKWRKKEIFCDNQKLIGLGGFAKVFEGMLGKSCLPVAVKRIEIAGLENNPDKINSEEALLHLEHPNVIKLYHIEADLDFRYYALELCSASLDQLYLEEGKYDGPILPVEDIILHLAKGLEYIHEKKLVHRDLKPANALIWVSPITDESDANNRRVVIKWADFGLSKKVNDSGSFSVSEIKGTLMWLAPEVLKLRSNNHYQREGAIPKELRSRGTTMSDVFSEGLTFAYIILEGKHPYGALPPEQIFPENFNETIAAEFKKIPAAYVGLRQVIQCMLKTDPTDRLTAKEVVEKLKNSSLEKEFSKLALRRIPSTQPGMTMEIQVAADTSIGRSEFSEIIKTESLQMDSRPNWQSSEQEVGSSQLEPKPQEGTNFISSPDLKKTDRNQRIMMADPVDAPYQLNIEISRKITPDLTKILGIGRQAIVFHGVFQRKPVAVKRVMLENVDSTCKQNEALIRKLKHPNVVKLFYAESDSIFRYYALELCEASLDKIFVEEGDDTKYRGPVPPVEDILLQLASGLQYIHEKNLVHHDLKPENALICLSHIESSSGKSIVVMKWSDFGLSKHTKGTHHWFAPEILDIMGNDKILNRRGTQKSDVFAEGLTFGYTLLEGKHLYGDEYEIRYNLKKDDAINLKRIANIPKRGKLLYRMFCSMLKPDPNQRLSAKAVSKQLEQIYEKKYVPLVDEASNETNVIFTAVRAADVNSTEIHNREIDKNECNEIAALGRPFELRHLYDYQSDRVTDDLFNFGCTLQVDEESSVKLMSNADSESTSDKWESMGLDDHLKASTMCGLIDKYKGASNYLNEKKNPSEVARVLILRAVTKKERLNLLDPVDYEVVKSNVTRTTHIVVGVTYGFEAYCIIFQKLFDLENERDRKTIEGKLDVLVNKLKKALNEKQDWADFQDKLNRGEKQCLMRTKCRLYSDLQTQTVRECNVSDAYKHFLKLTEEFQKTSDGERRAVPISVVLYPLKSMMGETKGDVKLLQYRDVDNALVTRCCRLLSELECITSEATTLRSTINKNNKGYLRQFTEAIVNFSSLLKKDLKTAISKARKSEEDDDAELANIIDAAERHPLFKPPELKRWLGYKRAELEMTEKISKMKDITMLARKNEVEKELSAFFDQKYALVMWIPPLNEKTNKILEAMTNYVKNHTKVVARTPHKDDAIADEPWHMEPRKRTLIEDGIRKFSEHVAKNKSIKRQVQFFVAFGESSGKKFGCRYSIYEAKNLLKDNLHQLPGPPTNLRIQLAPSGRTANTNKLSSVCVLWDYEDLGYPCIFLVDYRTKGNIGEPWIQQKTLKAGETQLIINISTGSVIEARVAADTCIGRSDFSEVVDNESLANTSSYGNSSKDFDISCSQSLDKEFQTKSKAKGFPTQRQTESPSTNLRRYPKLQREVYAPTPALRSNFLKDTFTHPRTTTAANVRFAELIKEQCPLIVQRDGMDLYSVPLSKSGEIGNIAERYSFGRVDNSRTLIRKTILLMGATGSGKTSLINGMINYIFDVQWSDPYRFLLIQEQLVGRTQAHSQTSKIMAYDIYHQEGFRIPYSLTIVDTPGYGDTSGIDRDKEITEMVRQFFEDKGGIQELDVVGFVTPASIPRLTPMHIFDTVLALFGKEMKENIHFLLTFADRHKPPVLKAITESNLGYPMDAKTRDPLYHKFNNSGFFCFNNRESGGVADRLNKFYWQMSMGNFEKFFDLLIKMRPKSLSLTKEVLEERKRLEATVDGLQPLIKIALQKMEEIKKLKKAVVDNQEHIKANSIVQFDFEATVPVQVNVPDGTFGTNCNNCKVTCHYPCSRENDDGKVNCSAMDRSMPEEVRRCTVCPEKCLWMLHSNQPYKWEYVPRKQATTSEGIKTAYESQLNTKMTTTNGLIEALEDSVRENEQAVLEKVETAKKFMARLDTIALRPNPFSTPAYIDLIIIDAEQQEMRPGSEKRIASLERLRSMVEIQNKIRNNIPLLENVNTGPTLMRRMKAKRKPSSEKVTLEYGPQTNQHQRQTQRPAHRPTPPIPATRSVRRPLDHHEKHERGETS